MPAIASSLANSSGRVAVVTGGNKGVGFHIAFQLAKCGKFGHVVIGCRDESRGTKAVDDIVFQGGGELSTAVSYLPLTIGDKESHIAFRKSIEDKFGRLDVLVNNAGMAFKGSDTTPFEKQCKPTLDVNFHGTVDFTEEMLPLVRKGEDARIVNVASMSGKLSQLRSDELKSKFTSSNLTMPELRALVDQFQSDVENGVYQKKGWGNSNYGLSKLALIAATKVWAREEDRKIKVNCCCPGYCDTDMTSNRGHRAPSEGAKNAVIPATMDDCPTGEFFSDFKVAKW